MNKDTEKIVNKINKSMYGEDKKIALELIKKFIQRQEFALKLLKDDPKINEDPEVGFMFLCGQPGIISNNKDWRYFLHGRSSSNARGIRLTNKKTEEEIDFDLSESGETGLFDDGWMCNYVQCEIRRLALHPKKYLDFVFISHWTDLLNKFEKEGIIKRKKRYYIMTDKAVS